MASLETRVAALEDVDPPAVSRREGEPTGMFFRRFGAAVTCDRPDATMESLLTVVRPWVAAMTHAELRQICDALEAKKEADLRQPALTERAGSPS